jgi:hypothetical protein
LSASFSGYGSVLNSIVITIPSLIVYETGMPSVFASRADATGTQG